MFIASFTVEANTYRYITVVALPLIQKLGRKNSSSDTASLLKRMSSVLEGVTR